MPSGSGAIEAARYAAAETLRDGRRVVIRSIRPGDRDALLAAVRRASPQSMFRRFFAVRRQFSERELAFFVDVDFERHVALVAVTDGADADELVGSARYVQTGPGAAELAFAVIDSCQGQGLGTALMRHLVGIARAAGLRELTAEVLPENLPMLKVLERSGVPVSVRREPDVVHVSLTVS